MKALRSGDLLFLISCTEIVDSESRNKFKKVLVIHASDLPIGRGWSPHIWQILEGKDRITLTLLEAEKEVDTGDIWKQMVVTVPSNALWDEINKLIFDAECLLMDFAVANFDQVNPVPQNLSIPSSYYPKRKPSDSELNPEKGIAEQFDLLRVCDPARFPAYFRLRGCEYKIRLEKI
jgi:methionyl-tRNA formyltransferase